MRQKQLLFILSFIISMMTANGRTQDDFHYTHQPEIGTYTNPATSSGISTFNFRFNTSNDSYTSTSTNYDNNIIKVTVKQHNSNNGEIIFTLKKQDGSSFVVGNHGKVVLWDVTVDKAYPCWYSIGSSTYSQDVVFNQVGNFTGSRTFRIFRIDASGNKLYAGEIRMYGSGIGKPDFVTGRADVNSTTVKLWGSVSPNGAATHWQFYYGTSINSLTESTPMRVLNATSGTFDINETITGLIPNQKYYYQLVGYNSEGIDGGYIEYFYTEGSENSAPTKPKNPSPATNSTDQPVKGTLRWSCSDADDDDIMYTIYLGTSTSSWKSYASNTNSFNYSLENDTKYYWKVEAYDGTDRSESDVWNFKTVANNSSTCPFPDCTTDELKEAATYLYNKKIVEGENGKFLPDREVTRAEVAKTTLYGVYGGRDNVPNVLPSDNYPSVYDLSSGDYYYRAAKALLYLEYGDGVAPFDRNLLKFDPSEQLKRIYVLKVLMEAFNVQPDLERTNNPYNSDADVVNLYNTNPRLMGYLRKAYDMGIVNTSISKWRPYAPCTRGEAFLILYRIMKKTNPAPNDADYFHPLNTTLKTIALGMGLPMGNFNHYSKTSFALSGTVPLIFAHTYNSYNTTLPELFYGARYKHEGNDLETYQPMGDGWSHNYHSFITIVGSLGSSDARVIVHWGGGKIDVYKPSGSNLVPESYGVYDDIFFDGSDVIVKTKAQMEYRFCGLSGTGNSNSSAAVVLYLSSIKDRNGNTLTLNYQAGVNGTKRITSVSDGNRSLAFTYGLSGTDLLTKVSDPLGRSIKFDYEYNKQTGHYQLKSFTDAENNTTSYNYGDKSKVSTSKLLEEIQLPKGNYIRNEYDANNRLAKTDNGTSSTSVKVNVNYGSDISTTSRVTVERGSKSSTFDYTYNANNVVTSLLGNQRLYVNNTYDANNGHPELPIAMQSNNTHVSNISYDTKGNITSITVSGDGENLTTTMTYDSMNNLTSITDPQKNKTTYSYNSKGNLVGISAPEGVTTSITVNSKGQPTEVSNPMGVKTTYEYNTYGNLAKVTLPALSLSSSASYDDASRLISVTDALRRTNRFTYDDNDNIIKSEDADNNETRFSYDENDNMKEITNAKDGVTSMSYDYATDWLRSVSFAGAKKEYDYNDDGTLDTYTKPDGTTLSYRYDDLGRVISDGVNSYSYDNKLRLSAISDDNSTISFTYDGFNRIIGTRCNGNVNSFDNSYEYDKNGNCIRVNNTTYFYDKLNRMTSVSFNGKTITYTYRKDSQLSKVTYPNGMTTEYGYDAVGRLTSKKTKLGNGTVITSYNYMLDKVGNITSQTIQEPYGDMNLANEDVSYSYNSCNRITKAGDISFSFDANGNTTKRGSELYSWDEQDRLTRAGSTNIEYDPLGLIASYGDIEFTTDPLGIGNVLSDSKGAEYIYGNGLEARVKNGAISYYVTDVRGSVVAIVDENGNITHKYQYDEFGKVTQKEEADYNPFQYVGKYGVMYLSDHLYYMRARHYDPTIGRFLSEDPIWSTNLYPYAENNPIRCVDPEGKESIESMSWMNLLKGMSSEDLLKAIEDGSYEDLVPDDYDPYRYASSDYIDWIKRMENWGNNQQNNQQNTQLNSRLYGADKEYMDMMKSVASDFGGYIGDDLGYITEFVKIYGLKRGLDEAFKYTKLNNPGIVFKEFFKSIRKWFDNIEPQLWGIPIVPSCRNGGLRCIEA